MQAKYKIGYDVGCHRKDYACMKDITLDEVLGACGKILG
jgi:hypothetical protein